MVALQQSIEAGEAWRGLYMRTVASVKREREATGRDWELDNSSIFAQVRSSSRGGEDGDWRRVGGVGIAQSDGRGLLRREWRGGSVCADMPGDWSVGWGERL